MNAKHLACVVLFIVVCALFQGTMMLKQRWVTAMQATADASASHDMARNEQAAAQRVLTEARKATAARRKYLELWRPLFEQSGTELSAKNEFNRMLKRFSPPLAQFKNRMENAVENKEMTYVNRRIAGTVKLEGDAEKTIQLLAAIERELPTSRISTLELRKGQRANDVELDLSVEFPLLAAPAAPAAARASGSK